MPHLFITLSPEELEALAKIARAAEQVRRTSGARGYKIGLSTIAARFVREALARVELEDQKEGTGNGVAE